MKVMIHFAVLPPEETAFRTRRLVRLFALALERQAVSVQCLPRLSQNHDQPNQYNDACASQDGSKRAGL